MAFVLFRIYAVLRRIAKALERANELAEQRIEIEAPLRKKARPFQLGVGSVERWNDIAERKSRGLSGSQEE
jgi:hypothetical protein